MEIKTLYVKHYQTGFLNAPAENVFHKKVLPFISVVQSVEGSYDISLGDGPVYKTGEKGVFVAPSSVTQSITHHVNALSGMMYAHWLFLDVIVNDYYRLDSLYDLPVILPPEFNQTVFDIISNVRNNKSICSDMSDIFRLVEILISYGRQKADIDPIKEKVTRYINGNYSEKITAENLSALLGISVAGVFRLFKKMFGQTPSNYINEIRMQHSAVLLDTGDMPVGRVGEAVGIQDAFYFSKLFKSRYGVSPSVYRLNNSIGVHREQKAD